METSAGWMLWTMCACFCALDSAALRVTVRDSTVEVVRGDFVVLPCSFFTSSPLTRLNIIWTLAPFSSPQSPIQVIVYDHGQVMEDPSLIGRVAFTGAPWSADIVLNDTRVSDAGVYRCMVSNPPETADPGIGELVLSVLAPPSLPACQWDGDIDLGGSVTLTCTVADGAPTPHIRWHKLNPEELALPVNMDGVLSGSVQIVNVSSQTSGLYRCSASNLLGTQNCYINLSIYSTPDSPSGLLQGAVLTLSMTLLLVALLVLVLWLHRTRQDVKDDQSYNEIRGNGGSVPACLSRLFAKVHLEVDNLKKLRVHIRQVGVKTTDYKLFSQHLLSPIHEFWHHERRAARGHSTRYRVRHSGTPLVHSSPGCPQRKDCVGQVAQRLMELITKQTPSKHCCSSRTKCQSLKVRM